MSIFQHEVLARVLCPILTSNLTGTPSTQIPVDCALAASDFTLQLLLVESGTLGELVFDSFSIDDVL